MIVVDSSVIVAIAKEEVEAKLFEAILAQTDAMIATPSIVETKLALSSVMSNSGIDALLDGLVDRGVLSPVPFSAEMAGAAVEAFRRYGKGRGHPAQLNFGDCMTYATAKVLDAPLLFKGDDFSKTDIRPALR